MNERNFVAPLRSEEHRRLPPTIGSDALFEGDSIHVGSALASQHGTHEQTSGMDRSLAWNVRLIPYTLIVLVLALTLTRLSGGGWLLGFCLFAGLSLGLYAVLDWREHKFSRNGLELHKVDSLVYLKDKQMEQTHELRKLALLSQIAMWRGVDYEPGAALDVGGGAVARRIEASSTAGALEGAVGETGAHRRAHPHRVESGGLRR